MKIKELGERELRSVEWNYENNKLNLIDQRIIPFRFEIIEFNTVSDIADAIRNMTVRGAPAIGAAAGFGIAQALKESKNMNHCNREQFLDDALELLINTRPTAIDLFNFATKTYIKAKESNFNFDETLKFAQKLADDMVAECKIIGERGAELIQDGDTILTHCNAGPVATIDYGTALAPFFIAQEQGKDFSVLVNETRPRLQGAKITAWELEQADINHRIIVDSAAAFLMSRNKIQKVFLGADRCLRDGTISNKIGTLSVAIAAKYYEIPFYSCFPWSTIDIKSRSEKEFEIEYRDENEIKNLKGKEGIIAISNLNSHALNPAFDITLPELITGYITAKGVLTQNQLTREIEKIKKREELFSPT